MSKKLQQGFTLIELMIVIAIIGILAAIAIPQYQDYVTKSKVSEGPSLVAAVQTAVATTYQAKGRYANGGNQSYGLPTAASITGNYVDSIEVVKGQGLTTQAGGTDANAPVIEIKYHNVGNNVDGDYLTYTPYIPAGSGSIIWICGAHTVNTPDGDKVGKTDGKTIVPNKFIPSNCRS